MTFTPKPRAEKKMATSGDISDFVTSGYSGGESHSLTVEIARVTSLVILLYSCT